MGLTHDITASSGNGSLARIAIHNLPAVGVRVAGTWVATLEFEGSIDGGANFIAVAGFPVGSSGALGTAASSATANDEWVFSLGGFSHFQVRASAYTSGTVTVSIEANAGSGYAGGASAGGGALGTVDTELPAAAALADAASAAPTTPTVGAVPLLMNATTLDRARAVVNTLDSTGTGIAAVGIVGQFDDTAPTAVTENQFAPVRISSRRALLVEGVASGTGLALATQGYSAAVSVTRPADTAVYAANDILGPATGSTAAITFPSMGPASGRVMITSASLERDVAALIAGETSYVLYLYNVTPPSALGDNAAFDLPAGDRASFLGSINLGTPVDLGSTLYIAQHGLNQQILLAATPSIFGYLVTVGTYTPASASVHVVTLHTVAV